MLNISTLILYLYPLFRIPFFNNKSLTPSSITITPTLSTNSIFNVYFVRYTFSSLSRISWLLTTLKKKDSQWRIYPELSSDKCSALEMRSLPGTRNQMLLKNIWFMCIVSFIMLRHDMICQILYYVILCIIMLHYVILCYVILYYLFTCFFPRVEMVTTLFYSLLLFLRFPHQRNIWYISPPFSCLSFFIFSA